MAALKDLLLGPRIGLCQWWLLALGKQALKVHLGGSGKLCPKLLFQWWRALLGTLRRWWPPGQVTQKLLPDAPTGQPPDLMRRPFVCIHLASVVPSTTQGSFQLWFGAPPEGEDRPSREQFGPCVAVRSRPAAPLLPAAGKSGCRAARPRVEPPGGLRESAVRPRARLKPQPSTEGLPALLTASGRG